MTLRIGWFSTGRDEAARNLLRVVYEDIRNEGYDAKIAWIFSHREPNDGPENEESRQREQFLVLADEFGIPVKTLSHVRFMPELRKRGLAESPSAIDASPALLQWRDLYGEEVVKVVGRDPVDLVVMAGYMLIIGDPELRELDIVNIHPAVPWGPRGTWQECIHEIIDTDQDEHGIMVHLVTKTLDRGPVISFCRFPVKGAGWDDLRERWKSEIGLQSTREERESHPLFLKMREVGEIRELPLLNGAIREMAFGNIEIRNKQIWAGGKVQDKGVELTDKIEEIVARPD
jgi:phosphoribosylglycinamide formyltransferase 1